MVASRRLLLVLALWDARRGAAAEILREGEELSALIMVSGEEMAVQIATPLTPDALFEVRVSYMATEPADFSFRLDAPAAQAAAGARDRAEGGAHDELRRRQLNTERFRIASDARGWVLVGDGKASAQAAVVVRGVRTGVRPAAERQHKREREEVVRFNLALDRLHLAAIPQSAFPMIAWGLVCVALALLVLRPALVRLFD